MVKNKVRVKTLKINGIDVTGQSNQTILEVAHEHNIKIPTLCYLKGLSCVGSCRICIVEIKGSSKLTPSCTAKIKEGMEIVTDSPRIQRNRKMILSMMFTERTHTCSVCISNGNCELQNQSTQQDMLHSVVPYINKKYDIDASHKNFVHDPNRCVLCTRCIRVCDEVEGAHAIDLVNRGIDTRVIHDMDEPWANSTSCTSCGKCVYVCPTGAMYEKNITQEEVIKKTNIITNLLKNRSCG